MVEEVAENRAHGMTEEEAWRRARLKFGNPAAVRETLWRQNTMSLVDTIVRDLRYSMRTLLRAPGFSLIAIGVMALCIGASTSLFTIVRSVLLKPLPFRDPDRLVMVYERYRLNQFPIEYNAVSPGDYLDWRAETHGFEDMAAWAPWPQFNLTGARGELPEVIHGGAGTWNFFPLIGIQPALGRTFTQAEDRWGADTVVLTWSLFERRFGGDPSIVGRQIHLDAKPYTVVGVLPRSFSFPEARVQLWVPYQSITPPQYLHHHAFHQTRVVARMKDGVSLADAIAQVSAVQYRLSKENPDQAVCEGAVTRTMNDDLARNVKKPLLLLVCAVACMLLIGCLNVANLLVARGAARQKEVAIRGALGAQRLTLIREQLMESVVICVAGGTIGMLVSMAATQGVGRMWKDLPSASTIHVDTAVLTFACTLVFVTALLAGLLPAISSTGKSVLAALQASARTVGGNLSQTALRKGLLTVEIAATVVLLIAAGLLLKNFLQLRSTDPHCATDNVLTMSYSLPKQKYDTPSKIIAFHEGLVDRLSATPGVLEVGLGESVPGKGEVEEDVFTIPEHPPVKPGNEMLDALVRRADPGYFHALEIPLLSGRFFTREDTPDQAYPGRVNKVIINREFAREQFPNEDPLGKHLQVLLWNDTKYEIIGVVADTLHQVNAPVRPTMYFPQLSGSDQDGTLVVRTVGDPLVFAVPIQKQIAALDPELPVSNVLTVGQIVGNSLGDLRLMATLVLVLSTLSLLLASVGLYGVLSYLMTLRTTELGIRIALGAQRDQVLRLMLLDGLQPAIFGLGLGLTVSAAATRVVQSMLYGMRPFDPLVFALVAFTLLAVAILACITPAWRASRLDPVQALRAE
jgi:predicted permease